MTERRAFLRSACRHCVGLAALSASLPFWLPSDEAVPIWAWIAGGAGLTIAAAGFWLWSGHNSLDEDTNQLSVRVPLGPLVAMHAIPFVSVPIVYLMREAFDTESNHLSAFVTSEGRGVSLRVTGAF